MLCVRDSTCCDNGELVTASHYYEEHHFRCISVSVFICTKSNFTRNILLAPTILSRYRKMLCYNHKNAASSGFWFFFHIAPFPNLDKMQRKNNYHS